MSDELPAHKLETPSGVIYVAKNRILVKSNEPIKEIGGIELAVAEETEADRSTGEVLAIGEGWTDVPILAGDKVVFSSSLPLGVNGVKYSIVNFEDVLLVLRS